MNKTKVLIVIAIIAVLGSFYMFDLGRFITLEF
ncbi:MAG TPA: TVP38/TMEM64 family protein, partial [Gammaproteobacteria bacterium]|nr:TVP38/TMEM64 family protein [Gammaproteobacteria bacterium]